ARCGQQGSVQVVLLVDEGAADRGNIVQHGDQIGRRLTVDVSHCRGLLEVGLQRRHLRVDLRQVLVQSGKCRAGVVAVSAQSFRNGRQRGIEIDRVDLVQQVDQRLEQRVDLELHRRSRYLGA